VAVKLNTQGKLEYPSIGSVLQKLKRMTGIVANESPLFVWFWQPQQYK